MSVVILAIYFAVGSWLYGGWYFGLVWGGQFNSRYLADGVWFLLDERFYPTVVLSIVAFVCLTLVTKSTRVIAAIDSHIRLIVATSMVAIVVTSLLVYHFGQNDFHMWLRSEEAYRHLETTIQALEAPSTSELLREPLDYLYLDTDGVAALYSQLEPELIEKKRTVTSNTEMKAEAGMEGAVGSARIEANKGKNATSSYERSSFAPPRQCLDTMKYLLGNQKAKYYSTFLDWTIRRIWQKSREEREKRDKDSLSHEPITKESIDRLREITPLDDVTSKEYQEKERKRFEQQSAEAAAEIYSAPEFLFVEGDYVLRQDSHGLVLTEQFSKAPRSILFKATAARALIPANSVLTQRKNLHLKIFGKVLTRLDNNGIVEIRPLAIF